MRVLPWVGGKIWVCAARPDHITLSAILHLRDCASDFQTVFTGGWAHSSYLDHSRNWLIWRFNLACRACRVKGVRMYKFAAKPWHRTGPVDCSQIWCEFTFRDQVVMDITQFMHGVYLHVARTDVPPFLYVVNGWTDCAEI